MQGPSSIRLRGDARMRNNIIVRLVAYYVAVLVVVAGFFRVFPSLGVYIANERARQGGRASLNSTASRRHFPLPTT